MPGIHLILCAKPIDLVHRMERLGRGEPDSSDEESETGHGYEGYEDPEPSDEEEEEYHYGGYYGGEDEGAGNLWN